MLGEYKTEQIRNVAIVGHLSTGKSTLLDAMLVSAGKLQSIGNPDSGLVSDYDEEEKKKKMSIRSALAFAESEGVKINIIDTPGTSDFVGEARAAIQAADSVILVVDSVSGIQIETEKAWRYIRENKIPVMIFINGMDRERADFNAVLNSLKTSFGLKAAVMNMPEGAGPSFKGVVDVVEKKLSVPAGSPAKLTVSEIPAGLKEAAESERMALIEAAAESDDALIEKFLEGEILSDEEIKKGLRKQFSAAAISPVACGCALTGTGVKNLLNIIRDYAPSPAVGKEYKGYEMGDESAEVTVKSGTGSPMTAVVWKTYIDQYSGRINFLKIISGELNPDSEVLNTTKNSKERVTKIFAMTGSKQEDVPKLNAGDLGVIIKLEKTSTGNTLSDPKNKVVLPLIKLPHPVFTYAIEAPNKNDADKVGQFIRRVTDENPTVTYQFNDETRETVLSGMGEMQLSFILNALKEKTKIEVITREPRIAYRETITRKAESQYKHKKQSGGSGQYGEVHFRLAPKKRGEGLEFIDNIVGGVVPKQYIPGVQKGVIEACEEGVLAKFPVVDVSVELFYGSYHDVDSSEMAFKIAARQCFKKGMETAGPLLLEPIMNVSVFVDKEFMGDILSDITSRRGRVLGMDSSEDSASNISVIRATVPLSEMLRYSIDLRAMTSGKATFEMTLSHYDPISGREAEKAIEARKKQLEDEANK